MGTLKMVYLPGKRLFFRLRGRWQGSIIYTVIFGGLICMGSFWGHFRTITRHRNTVIKHCWKAGIFWQGLGHDLSKYSPTEFLPGVKFYTGKRSPTDWERETYGYSRAWIHHKGRNRHHYEYWTDFCRATGRNEPVKMPFNWVVEMLCDRVAASKIYRGDEYTQDYPLKYFRGSEAPNNMHPETRDFVDRMLVMLSREGEDKMFACLRKMVREKQGY